MKVRQTIFSALLISAAAIAAPTLSSAAIVVDVDVAPPAQRIEVVPAARSGFVWAPGYWNWNGHRHVWVGGRWVGERHGYHWAPHNWVQREGRWHFEEGGWRR